MYRHCWEQILARQWEVKAKRVKVVFFLRWSQVKTEEMSFQVTLEYWQGSSSPDGGGKIIPPARNGERECSGKGFCASLWWYHETTLARRSQNWQMWFTTLFVLWALAVQSSPATLYINSLQYPMSGSLSSELRSECRYFPILFYV